MKERGGSPVLYEKPDIESGECKREGICEEILQFAHLAGAKNAIHLTVGVIRPFPTRSHCCYRYQRCPNQQQVPFSVQTSIQRDSQEASLR